MNNHKLDFECLSRRIEEILLKYVKCSSLTNTGEERTVEKFFTQLLGEISYFKSHADCWGLYPVPEYRLERNVCWAMAARKRAEDCSFGASLRCRGCGRL